MVKKNTAVKFIQREYTLGEVVEYRVKNGSGKPMWVPVVVDDFDPDFSNRYWILFGGQRMLVTAVNLRKII